MLGRLLSRKGSRKGETEEEAKVYKKAHLGESLGQLYFNEELKMWVERGKEDEARAEKAKLSAPPPSVGTMSAASSSTSLNTAGADAAGAAGVPPVPGGSTWTRGRSLKDRYIATPGAGPPPPSGTGSNSCPPSGKSALLPGSGPASGSGLVPGIPKVPGLPAGPSRPGSFFMPTPAASDTASEAAAGGNGGDNSSTAGGMSQSQSGMSMDAFVPGGAASGKAPAFFMPAVPAHTSSGGAAESGAAKGQDESESTAAGAADVAMGDAAQDAIATAAATIEGRDSSAGGSLGELSRPGNLSFARWTPQPAGGVHDINSPSRSSTGAKQQNAAGHLPFPGAGSNGNHVSYAPYSNGGAYGNFAAADGVNAEGAAAASAAATYDAGGAAAPGQYSNSEWSTHPASDTPAAGTDGGEAGGYDSWQQQQQQDPFGQPQDPFGQLQDPFGQSQDPFSAPVALSQDAAAAAEGTWAGADAEGGADYNAASSAPAAAEGYSADGYAYNQYNGWEQQGYGYGHDANAYQPGCQQGAAEGGEAAQQQQYCGMANGYYGTYDSSGYHAAGEATAEQQQQGVVSELSASEGAVLLESAAGEADGAAEATTGYDQHAYYQQQHVGQQQQHVGEQQHHQQQLHQHEQQQQQMPVLLDPVHPELPGISTTLTREGSDELGPLLGSTSATAAKRITSASAAAAAARHQSAPGSAPHPARYGSGIPSPGGAAGGYLSVPPVRSKSLHTPGAAGAAGVNPLLPPHRASFNGSGSPPLQAESSTLTVPTPAVVGDTSMLTMVRPSSPYARSVSPLTQQRSQLGLNRGDSSSSPLARGDSGFPIPSPPTQMLGKPGVFIPGSTGGAAAAMAPWQPVADGIAVDAAAAEATKQHSSAGVHGAAQGSGFGAPMVLDGYMGTTGSQPYGAGSTMDRRAGAASAGGSAPLHVAAANGNGSLPWAGSQQHDADAAANKGTDRLLGPGSMPGSASSAPWQQQHGQEQRTHPYDAFVNTELVNVNWRAHHYKQPGKLNRQTPYEEFEMQRAREQEAQELLTPTKKQEAFWYRQMEYRRKLPAGSMKPSASEPAHMPSNAAAGRAAGPPSPGDSSLSQASNYTDWQQHHIQQQQQQVAMSPCTPARAVTADAAYAVAGRSPGEEPTPTSKFMPLLATAEDGSEPPAAAAANALDGSSSASASHQQQVGMPGVAAEGSGQATADGSSWQVEQQQQQQQHAQYYGAPNYGGEVQPDGNAAYQYPAQYYAQWQAYYAQQGYPQQGYEQQQGFEQQQGYEQQQQPLELDQQEQQQLEQLQQQHQSLDQQQKQQQHLRGYGSELERLPTDEQAIQQSAAASTDGGAAAGGSATAAASSPAVGLWGDGIEQQQQQQLDAATAAAADEAASAWDANAGAFDALELPAEQVPLATVDSNAAAEAAAHAHDFHDQYQHPQRSARVSMSSSTGGSQPSTAKAAAAASRHIVSSAISRIIQEHDGEAAGAAVAGLAGAAADLAAAAGVADAASVGIDEAALADGREGDAGDGWEVDEQAAAAADGIELVPGYEAYPAQASAAAADEQEQQAGEVAADAAALEDSAEAAAAAPVYPTCWQRMRQLMASTPMGDDFAAYRDPFVTYGDWLFWQLPDLAAADEGTAAGDSSSDLQQQQQAEHLELLEMYGEAQMKADVMADAFKAGGLDLDAVFEQLALCDGEAADLSLL